MNAIKIVGYPAGTYYTKNKDEFEAKLAKLFSGENEVRVMPTGKSDKYTDYGFVCRYLISHSQENLDTLKEWSEQLGSTTDRPLPAVAYNNPQLSRKQLRSALFAGISIKHESAGKMILQPLDCSEMTVDNKRYIVMRRVG